MHARRTAVVMAMTVLLPLATVAPAMATATTLGPRPAQAGGRRPGQARAARRPARHPARRCRRPVGGVRPGGHGRPVAGPDPVVPNLVRNPSFEDPGSPRSGFVGTFASIPGWTETTGRGIEIQTGCFRRRPTAATSTWRWPPMPPSSFYQDVPTQPGTRYRLTFRYSPHPNTAADVNPFDVTFGETTASLAPAASSTVDWKMMVLEITAQGPTTRLTFTDSAHDADHGLRCVPRHDRGAPDSTESAPDQPLVSPADRLVGDTEG